MVIHHRLPRIKLGPRNPCPTSLALLPRCTFQRVNLTQPTVIIKTAVNNTRYIIIAVLVVIAGLLIYFQQTRPVVAPEPITPLSDKQTSPATETSELITVTSPTPNQLISSPLIITGQVRGNWFFEATAPVELIDANGNKIAKGNITANGDWMTTEFVPFTAT